MAATVLIVRLTGSGPTENDITSSNTRANASDIHTIDDTVYGILIPQNEEEYNYSYWVTTRLKVASITNGTISNVKWYQERAFDRPFGSIYLNVGTATDYTQATGTLGQTGIELNSVNYPSFTSAGNAYSYIIDMPFFNNPLSVTGSTSTTGQFGDRVVFQFKIGSFAQGNEDGDKIFFLYDDTSS
jgi:hypothetical protein